MKTIFLTLLLIIFTLSHASAYEMCTIKLHNGGRLSGELIADTPEYITLYQNGITTTLNTYDFWYKKVTSTNKPPRRRVIIRRIPAETSDDNQIENTAMQIKLLEKQLNLIKKHETSSRYESSSPYDWRQARHELRIEKEKTKRVKLRSTRRYARGQAKQCRTAPRVWSNMNNKNRMRKSRTYNAKGNLGNRK